VFQTEFRNIIKQSKTIPRDHKWKYINLNPSASTVKGLIKLHKLGQHIRPVVNWRNILTYKLSKLFTHKINSTAPLPKTFNIKNTTELLQNLWDTLIHPHFTFASLDITNLYSNILIKETKMILTDTLKYYQIDQTTQQELLMWYTVITRHNYQLVQWKTGIFFFYRAFIANTEIIILLLFLYFTQMHDIISQYDGLAIGAPSSGLIAELVLQHTKNTHLA